jgi:hypothetical protein
MEKFEVTIACYTCVNLHSKQKSGKMQKIEFSRVGNPSADRDPGFPESN